MSEVTRLVLRLGLAGVAVTLAGGVARWYGDEGRRVRRGLTLILAGEPHGFLVARGRGRGIGFNFTSNQVAVAWNQGAWGLRYSLDELMGAEAIVDGQIVGRVHRGEARRAIDAVTAEQRVALRLVFDDVAHPDFTLDLWLPGDAGRSDELPPDEAIEEANRWLARIEALLRRPVASPRTMAPSPPTATAVLAPAFQKDAAADDGRDLGEEDEDAADDQDDRRDRAII